MSHEFEAELIVPNLAENVSIALRDEVIELVDAAVSRESEDSLLGEQIIEFEFA